MRIAPRTMLCGIAYRVHLNVAGDRFDELRELCTAAGDKASLAIGMAGLVLDHAFHDRLRETSQLAHPWLISRVWTPPGARRWVGSPERVDQRVHPDMSVRVGRQHRENGALVRAGRRDIRSVGIHLERSENPDVHDSR
jgi:hypothetical protein